MSLIWTLLIGGIAGFIAGKLVKGSGSGIILNVILGIVGSWLGQWVFSLMKISISGVKWPYFLTSLAGAVIILFLYGIIFKKR